MTGAVVGCSPIVSQLPPTKVTSETAKDLGPIAGTVVGGEGCDVVVAAGVGDIVVDEVAFCPVARSVRSLVQPAVAKTTTATTMNDLRLIRTPNATTVGGPTTHAVRARVLHGSDLVRPARAAAGARPSSMYGLQGTPGSTSAQSYTLYVTVRDARLDVSCVKTKLSTECFPATTPCLPPFAARAAAHRLHGRQRAAARSINRQPDGTPGKLRIGWVSSSAPRLSNYRCTAMRHRNRIRVLRSASRPRSD